MSLESTQQDAARLRDIRATGRELKVPDTLIECVIRLGYSTEEADALFATYKHDGCLRLCNNAGWGDKCPDQPTKPKDE